MCGIIAYTGAGECRTLLIEGLQKLEYRGYDSAGIITQTTSGDVYVRKAVGEVSVLAQQVQNDHQQDIGDDAYMCGIGHTRWATHGYVTLENTHPHVSENRRFYIVHNGVIDNYRELKTTLEEVYNFYGDTDTEVIAKLIEQYACNDIQATIQKVACMLQGAFAFVVLDTQNPGVLFAYKLGSPLVVVKHASGIYIASDISAIPEHVDTYTSLEDNDMVVATQHDVSILHHGQCVTRKVYQHTQIVDDDEVSVFSTYTEKEIHEIPDVMKRVYDTYTDGHNTISHSVFDHILSTGYTKFVIVASGSGAYAAYIGSYMLRQYSEVSCDVYIGSEFLTDAFFPDRHTLYIFLSQSGETADIRESIKKVQHHGVTTLSIVNVVSSTIAHMTDMTLYNYAGKERGVASTKNIISQCMILFFIACVLGKGKRISQEDVDAYVHELYTLPDILRDIYTNSKDTLVSLAKKYHHYEHVFILGRGILYPLAGEVALKIKELSYIHAEAYSVGELKHGPFALITSDVPVLVFHPDGQYAHKTASNVEEIKARGGKVIGCITQGSAFQDIYTDTIQIPKTSELMSIFPSFMVSYLFSVYITQARGNNVDKPRNLAKSVTVE